MESPNKEKTLTEEYIRQNKIESEVAINLDSAVSSPAPLGKRFAAGLIDMVILLLFLAFVIKQFFDNSDQLVFLRIGIDILTNFIFAGYFYSCYSATPGKLFLGLRVIKASGAKLNFIEGGVRDSFGKLLSGFTLGVGYLMILFRADGRALHDFFFDTNVVIKEP